ncbi:Crp/Fnr family transcriptional regulator [Sphingomonas sp. ACRSK]|uniref:Crp/Fnr family transcriptional regulator n=1 Tax=Sphingomonas sp. ACRSK TaxID=2918213 RepID=UPI001EF53EE2|nr:Crp/Fnr family transcriptional regulator [Sphingomonas sp. ACRSK]MCG7347452.1 Crp/Fnr family transcriptional regulator [Sphingomonas sp. ACRSK]
MMLIRRLGNYARLTPEDEAALQQMLALPIRLAHARRDIIAEGAVPRAVFLIVSGWACQFKTLEDGRRQIVGFLLPGDSCDLNNLVLRRMDHSIGALTDVRYMEIPGEAIQRLTRDHPRIGKALWWQMLVHLSVQREWTTNLGQRNAMERLGSLLCELALRLRDVGLSNGECYDLPLTQTDLADATGLTSVHINRTLQQLRASGLISLSGRVLRIPNFAALQEASLFAPDYLHRAQREARQSHGMAGAGVADHADQ